MIGEFALISKYFTKDFSDKRLVKGIGDDCALLSLDNDLNLAITTDTLNKNIHFFADEDPYSLGYKSLLVNVSDLAAMGAKPRYFTLSLTLDNSDEVFLEKFSQGLFALANSLDMILIGGNTSKGELSITIEAMGLVPKDKAYLRENAKNKDYIYITNTLGVPGLFVDARYKKIEVNESDMPYLHDRAMLMENRCKLSCALSDYVDCAIDISDGLVGDLKHILEKSNKGAILDMSNFIFDDVFKRNNIDIDKALHYALYGGGDYELLFTLRDYKESDVLKICKEHGVFVQKIGIITDNKDLQIKYKDKSLVLEKSFEHF